MMLANSPANPGLGLGPLEAFEAPPDCACDGTELVIEVPDSGTAYYRPGYVDEWGESHGTPCPCVRTRKEYEDRNTCAHCGRLAAIVAHVTPDEAVCDRCVGGLL